MHKVYNFFALILWSLILWSLISFKKAFVIKKNQRNYNLSSIVFHSGGNYSIKITNEKQYDVLVFIAQNPIIEKYLSQKNIDHQCNVSLGSFFILLVFEMEKILLQDILKKREHILFY